MTELCPCLRSSPQCQCYNGLVLSTESSVAVYGTLTLVPEGKQVPQFVCLGSAPLSQFIIVLVEGEAEVGITMTLFGWEFGLEKRPNVPKLLLSPAARCVTGEL